MSLMTTVQALPRTTVAAYLRAARLPLSLVERVTGQTGNEQWPPRMAYEGFEAGVETVVGGLLRDEVLVDKGRLRQAALAQLRKATELETVAEQERLRAEQTFEARRDQAEQKRVEAERHADKREQEIERQAAQQERKVQQQAAQKAATARNSKAARDKAIDRQERVAKTAALSKEARALDAAKQALQAEGTVEVIDETIEGTKAARKSS
jgi:hypothetical protein